MLESGTLEGAAGNVRILSGRFGPYVTDGVTNATLPKGTDPAKIDAESANRVLSAKREKGPSERPAGGRFGAKKAAPKTAAKKPAAKKPAAKKAPTKKKA